MLKKFATIGALALIAMVAPANTSNWNTNVVVTDGGHQFGNPDAKLHLVEFVSYTCPHCAHFSKDGDGALQLAYVGPGKITREIRHVVRDPVDLTAAMLSNCGAPAKFLQNHNAFMLSQDKWLPLISSASPAQIARWTTGDYAARRRSIASDFGFYAIMERRGYRRTDVDRCLADDKKATQLTENTQKNFDKYNISGTPSFAINGVTLAGTHAWSVLEPQLKARFPAK